MKDASTRLKTRIGWRKTTSERMNNMPLTRETTTPHLPPWKNLDILTVDAVPLDKPKEEYTPEELKRMSMQKIRSINTEVTIYTDGSTNGEQQDGGAGVYIIDANGNTLLEASYPAGSLCSSYTGECVAMLRALEWLQMNPMVSLICTDSLSLQSALAENNWKDRDPWLKKIKEVLFELKEPVTLLWIPSHCDIPGNEKADELAKVGGEFDQDAIPVTHQIVRSKIKSRKWVVEHPRASETYGDLRKPKYKEERQWPKKTRSLYARLRTGHAKELKHYRWRIEQEDDALCEECGEEDETIEHVLCKCGRDATRQCEIIPGRNFNLGMLTTHPEECRRLLERRFEELKLPPSEDPD